MKNKSKYVVFLIVAIASAATITQAYDSYRRGGLFGGGGILGTGVGASRSGDYYSTEPGVISRTGNTVSNIADDVTGRRSYHRRGRRYRKNRKYDDRRYYGDRYNRRYDRGGLFGGGGVLGTGVGASRNYYNDRQGWFN